MKFFLFSILIFGFFCSAQGQKKEVVDQVIAVVNGNIILKSDVDSLARTYVRDYNQPFSEGLWYQLFNAEIEKFILIEQAKIDSIVVTDAEIDQKLEQRIRMMVQQAGSESVLEDYFGKTLIELRSEWRKMLRNDEIVNKVRDQKLNAIKITRPEVEAFFETIPRDSIPLIPEKVKLAQIVDIPAPDPVSYQKAFDFASALRDSILNHGKDIEDLARIYSQGPSGPNGGYLPLIEVGQLVAEYSAAASALEPGEISQVVETSYGFHVIRLNERVGDKISTNHILIKMEQGKVDETASIAFLEAVKDTIMTTDATFGMLARRHSEDAYTAPGGGVLRDPQTGEDYLPISKLDPSLYRIALLLENNGDISEPKPFKTNPPDSKDAFRIVQLQDRVEEHLANLEQDYSMFENFALQQKKGEFFVEWMNTLKQQIYVRIKISIPEEYQPIFTYEEPQG